MNEKKTQKKNTKENTKETPTREATDRKEAKIIKKRILEDQ